jgi:hypothetical protein
VKVRIIVLKDLRKDMLDLYVIVGPGKAKPGCSLKSTSGNVVQSSNEGF